ncbi:ribosomal RNA large subunit methyltransferase J [Striga asiatica]|uniref:Ribosomal RNA large subunit methyltransferase J n=1 Tax=Striga asiatica TaxID=4170 RepID=A0A5A7PKW8_STRAF|nr:ribosomal RNA large subunit methyltransferase J [Striga asiatica]
MATDSCTDIPFAAKIRSIVSTSVSAEGSEASTRVRFGGFGESLRPKRTLIVGPPDKATASCAANTMMSEHDTFRGQTASTVDFMTSINSFFRIPKFLEDEVSENLTLRSSGSRRMEPSQPYLNLAVMKHEPEKGCRGGGIEHRGRLNLGSDNMLQLRAGLVVEIVRQADTFSSKNQQQQENNCTDLGFHILLSC